MFAKFALAAALATTSTNAVSIKQGLDVPDKASDPAKQETMSCIDF